MDLNNPFGTACVFLLRLFLFLTLFPPQSKAYGQIVAEADTTAVELQEIEISATASAVSSNGRSRILHSESVLEGIRIMGEADFLNQLKLLPGIRTSGEYGSGFMIDGNTPSQSLFRLNGVPVFFPYRFGGIFSTFNTPHFMNMTLERGFHTASMPSRLGAKADFTTHKDIADKITGLVNAGMTASSISLRIPFASSVEIDISGRISYIDEVYGKWIKGIIDMGYKFWDLNFTTRWNIDNSNSLTLNSFINKDKLVYTDINYAMEYHLSWSNNLVSLSWNNVGNHNITNRIYWTGFNNNFKIILPQVGMAMPSAISILGVSGDMSAWLGTKPLKLECGYEINAYMEDMGNISTWGYRGEDTQKANNYMHPLESRIYGNISLPVADLFTMEAGVSAGLFSNSDGYRNFTIDPRISLYKYLGPGKVGLHVGRYSQYVHQVGFSQIGLASDFWISSRKGMPGTHSYNIEFDYSGSLSCFNFSASAYYRIIRDEPEYEGQLLNLLEIGYDPLDWIWDCNGFNYGLNLNVDLALNRFSSSVAVGYGVSRRKIKGSEQFFRASSDPGLTINIESSYSLSPHWEFGAVFKYATGRPYTPAKALFMIGGNIITEYGPTNSALFPAFHQLNLSVTWKHTSLVRGFSIEHLINFSFINAYGHRNTEIMNYIFEPKTGKFRLNKIYSLYRFFPSLNYTLKF